MDKLLLATNNKGKVIEYRSLLQGVPYRLVTPAELGITTVVREEGSTLEENARVKAVTLAEESGQLSLADDSGLEVDALGGAPGHFSARFAGENATDNERVSYLLAKLEGVPYEKRTARFRAVIAIAVPGSGVEFCEGECRGYITLAPRGAQGFGYDPVFYLPELDKTVAELPLEVKNRISHRSRAAQKAREVLLRIHRQPAMESKA
ncbi:MAG: XTP/dITP diphosphatase [Dehalococcoidales bacterium]|nr:XTP/dITP diphosphatase [Dehalococcoidales bacterium]